MRTRLGVQLLPFIIIACAFLSLSTFGVAAAPADDAVAQYRAYVAAIRAGKIEDVVKLVESVPDTSKPLVTARIKSAIALEALKKEMLAQMGPPKAGEGGWTFSGVPDDDVLATVRGMSQGEGVVGLRAVDPKTGAEGTVGWMIQRDGKWLVPAGMVVGLMPAPEFEEPDPEERSLIIKRAEAIAGASDSVLKRLKATEFTKPSEVQAALGQEVRKAGG